MIDYVSNIKASGLSIYDPINPDDDFLYILGDVIDRNGDGGVAMLRWIIARPNVQLLMGNHEAMMLDCDFEDEDSLKFYASHPEHNSVANAKVRPYTQTRLCLDYKEK